MDKEKEQKEKWRTREMTAEELQQAFLNPQASQIKIETVDIIQRLGDFLIESGRTEWDSEVLNYHKDMLAEVVDKLENYKKRDKFEDLLNKLETDIKH